MFARAPVPGASCSIDQGWPRMADSIPPKTARNQCSDLSPQRYDLLLPLANERGVRSAIASLSPTVTLHATTGQNWLSQLHRHVAGRDDCIRCRMGEVEVPQFSCSTGKIVDGVTGRSEDAALPFTSAASGLLLAVAVMRIARGELSMGARNDWRLHFDSPHKLVTAGVRRCKEGCASFLRPHVRAKLRRSGKYFALDTEAFAITTESTSGAP